MCYLHFHSLLTAYFLRLVVLLLVDPEDGSNIVLRNFGISLDTYKESHSST
jgi:hypothetical protein